MLAVSECGNEVLELRGRLAAVTAYVESATAHVPADLKGPDNAPPSRPSGDAVAAELAAVAGTLTRDIRSASAGTAVVLDPRGICADALGRTVRQIEDVRRAVDLGGGAAGNLAGALRDLLTSIS